MYAPEPPPPPPPPPFFFFIDLTKMDQACQSMRFLAKNENLIAKISFFRLCFKPSNRNYAIHTIKLKPREREAIKPAELIQVTGHQTLSLYARRAITDSWHNAHQQGVEPGKDYTIEIDNLKT